MKEKTYQPGSPNISFSSEFCVWSGTALMKYFLSAPQVNVCPSLPDLSLVKQNLLLLEVELINDLQRLIKNFLQIYIKRTIDSPGSKCCTCLSGLSGRGGPLP